MHSVKEVQKCEFVCPDVMPVPPPPKHDHGASNATALGSDEKAHPTTSNGNVGGHGKSVKRGKKNTGNIVAPEKLSPREVKASLESMFLAFSRSVVSVKTFIRTFPEKFNPILDKFKRASDSFQSAKLCLKDISFVSGIYHFMSIEIFLLSSDKSSKGLESLS